MKKLKEIIKAAFYPNTCPICNAVIGAGEKICRKRISASFRAGILEVTAGREIYRNKKSFGIDCIFDSKEGVSEVSYYRQPQRFSGF